jgi:hypothetical protein
VRRAGEKTMRCKIGCLDSIYHTMREGGRSAAGSQRSRCHIEADDFTTLQVSSRTISALYVPTTMQIGSQNGR